MTCLFTYAKRNIITALSVLCSSFLFAQVPSYIPYQAIARDQSGLAKSNTPVQVEFRIYNTMLSATVAYQEVHTITTNDFGYFNLRIGSGSVQSGTFNNIAWQTGDVSYEVWIDMGSGLSLLGGRTGFMAVPYALYAANASPSPTLTINAPNTVSNPGPGVYNIQVPTPSLALNGYSLSLSNANTVGLPGNYSAGNGISIAGTVISNSQPNQTVALSGNVVSGTYPSYTVNVPPAFTTSVSPGANMNINGVAPAYTISAITPTLSGAGNAVINGSYPNQTVNVAPQTLSITGNNLSLSGNGGSVMLPPTTTISSGTNVTIGGTAPNYTVSATTPTLTVTGYATLSGSYPTQTVNVPPQTLSMSGTTLALSNGGNTVDISNTHWSTTGNGATNITNNFIGTTNAVDLALRTSNVERLRVTNTGSIGIGTQAPAAFFDVDYGNLKLGAGSTPFSLILHGVAQKSNFSISVLASTTGTLSIPGAQVGDMLLMTLNDHTATGGGLSLSNAWVSAPGIVSYYLSSTINLGNVTATFSYLILRP